MLYYSNINEDSTIEREILKDGNFQTVVAVAGSGERVLALMDDESIGTVHIVDPNPEALFLTQLKIAALTAFDVETYLAFCGHRKSSNDRRSQYQEIRPDLDKHCRLYWDNKYREINKGIIFSGHFEKFLARLRPLLRFYLGRKFLDKISTQNAADDKTGSIRWNILQNFFKLKAVYKLCGNRDTAFISGDADVKIIPLALTKILETGKANSSFITHLIFDGQFENMPLYALPPTLQTPVLQQIKTRLREKKISLHYSKTDILSFVQTYAPANTGAVFYSLSDIPSFVDMDYMKNLLQHINLPGNAIVWRTFLRNRFHKTSELQNFYSIGQLEDHSHKESTLMYQVISVKA